MATTVNKAFDEFNKEIVNLDNNRTIKARNSREWLWTQLNKLETKEGLYFPFKYQDKHIKFGSFARKTKIRDLDDIDLMFCLAGNNAYYTVNAKGDAYCIHTENAEERLQRLSDTNILNSRRVVNKLKSALSNIPHYKNAELHTRGEAATLKLSSYEWNFDIVPCFYTVNDFYLIPDGKGNWKATDPRIDQKLVTNTNQQYDGRLLQLIRTLKYWNRYNSATTISSYLFEQLVINFTEQQELFHYIDWNIISFFEYLSKNIFSEVQDPKGFQGNINTLTIEQKRSISEKANWAFNKSLEAYNAEIEEKNQAKAINKWREIFGNKFPKYE